MRSRTSRSLLRQRHGIARARDRNPVSPRAPYVPRCRRGVAGEGADAERFQDTFKALWAFFTGQAQAIFTAITLAANQDITISGTAKYKRGSQVRHIPVAAGRQWSGTAMLNDVTYDKVTTTAATTCIASRSCSTRASGCFV
jgi:hypothetical protein